MNLSNDNLPVTRTHILHMSRFQAHRLTPKANTRLFRRGCRGSIPAPGIKVQHTFPVHPHTGIYCSFIHGLGSSNFKRSAWRGKRIFEPIVREQTLIILEFSHKSCSRIFFSVVEYRILFFNIIIIIFIVIQKLSTVLLKSSIY